MAGWDRVSQHFGQAIGRAVGPTGDACALQVHILMICFYCGKTVGANEDAVHGKAAIAHRACVHAQVISRLPDAGEYELAGKRRPGFTGGGAHWKKCARGHSLTEEGSVYTYPNGQRRCNKCRRIDQNARRARRRAAKAAKSAN